MHNPTMITLPQIISKLSRIPSSKWCVGVADGKLCAVNQLHALNEKYDFDRHQIYTAVNDKYNTSLVKINDGLCPQFRQRTPKARTLAALRKLL